MNETFNTVAEIIAAYKANKVSRDDVALWLQRRQDVPAPASASAPIAAKPTSIALAPLDSVYKDSARPVLGRPTVALAPLAGYGTAAAPAPAAAPGAPCEIDLVDQGDGILALDIRSAGTWPELGSALKQAMQLAAQRPDARVLMVRGGEQVFMPADGDIFASGAALLAPGYELPLIAVMKGDAKGAAWMFGALCDFMLCSEEGSYAYAPAGRAEELNVLEARFRQGDLQQLLLSGAACTGASLRESGLGVRVLPRASIDDAAMALAAQLAGSPRASLELFKRHMAQEMLALATAACNAAARGAASAPFSLPARQEQPLAAQLRQARTAPAAALAGGSPVSVDSGAVTVELFANGVVLLTMCDKRGKNMFTEELVDGVAKAFAAIARLPQCKVVVLTGYDNYFSCGGTKESLLAIHSGRSRFTDIDIYAMPSDVPVPVIGALQGHGIGAGWSLGMFCDVAIHSEKHTYLSPYMQYGFTPGAGSTLVFPEHFGVDLGREILFTAQEYTGSELRQRGAPVDIVPAGQVLPLAMTLATQLASLDRAALEAIKSASAARVRTRRQDAFAQEQAMHQVCFVGNDEVLARIGAHFNEGLTADSVAAAPAGDAQQASGAGVEEVLATLRTMLAEELFMTPDELDDDHKFIDIGLDSITGVNWVRKINERYGTTMNATGIYSHPTLREFAQFALKAGARAGAAAPAAAASAAPARAAAPRKPAQTLQTIRVAPAAAAMPAPAPVVAPAPAVASAPVTAPAPVAATAPVAAPAAAAPAPAAPVAAAPAAQPAPARIPQIAVIGMSGQFPKARNLSEFWRNLAEGRDCVSEIPSDRWDLGTHFDTDHDVPGKTYSKWMGALEDVAMFDPLFFNISPREAEWMDPQQRMFLQNAWHCVEDAGYSPASLSGSKCGVFVGCGPGDYSKEIPREQLNAQNFMGQAISILAAKIAYVLNLQGPCLSIDTACSSSLVALAAACDSLAIGSSDMALAGGVCVLAGPDMHIMTSKSGMLSPDGRCYSFDQRANGFVPGEGVGTVMLKRLEDAERDGDHVYGVISGWGVNQDGKTNGMTAPNPRSQARLEQEVYRKFGIDPATIDMIETHGTGTKLGDPIEVEGLKEAFGAFTDKTGFCALSSVKSNIGHTLAAAGIAGAIKLLLSLKHEYMPPTIHVNQVNEHIDLAGSPFYIGSVGQEWRPAAGRTRRSAISSFGFSGTNAHVVIEEYVARAPRAAAAPAGPVAVLLSARNDARLEVQARQLADFLAQPENAGIALADLAYTLAAGREPMEARIGIEAESIAQLRERLGAILAGTPAEGVARGQVQRGADVAAPFGGKAAMQDMMRQWGAARQWSKVLALWVRGAAFDWEAQHVGAGRRVSLPVYPFDQKRYWLAAPVTGKLPREAKGERTPGMLHPLLHENTSTFAAPHHYSSRFSGTEFFFAQHLILGRKVLPGVGHLEMVRCAMKEACGSAADSSVLQIKNVVWMRPIACHEGDDPDQRTVIHIALVREENDEIAFTIFSGGEHADQPVVVHSQGVAMLKAATAIPTIDLAAVRQQCSRVVVDSRHHFDAMVLRGADLGRGFRGIGNYHLGASPEGMPQVLAHIMIPDGLSDAADRFVLHPTAMDAAVHTAPPLMQGWEDGSDMPLALPFALAELEVLGSCQEEMYALARPAVGAAAGSLKFDIDLCDAAGMVCVRFKGFAFRVVDQTGPRGGQARPAPAPALQVAAPAPEVTAPAYRHDMLMLEPVWDTRDAGARAAAPDRRIVVLCGVGPVSAYQNLMTAELACLAEADTLDFTTVASQSLTLVQQVLKDRMAPGAAHGRTLVQFVGADPLLAGLSGLGRTLRRENPKVDAQVVLVEPGSAPARIAAQLDESQHFPTQPLMRFRAGLREHQRWTESAMAAQGSMPWREGGVYLVTGGAGSLGMLFAQEIVQQLESVTVVLTGRSTPDAALEARLATLADGARNRATARIDYRQLDVAQASGVEALVRSITQQYGRLDGVLHAAGVLRDNFILAKSQQELAEVFAPKVAGLLNLQRATANMRLDFMALFSSIASGIGNAGQADYAMANAYLDASAAHSDAAQRTVSINWPLWKEGGMAIDAQTEQWMRENTGLEQLRTADGIAAFYRVLASGAPQAMVLQGDADRIRQTIPGLADTPAPNTSHTPPDDVIEVAQPTPNVEQVQMSQQPTSKADTAHRFEEVLGLLRPIAARILKIGENDLDIDKELINYGFDSISLTEFTNHVNKQFKIASSRALNPTVFFEHPTLRSFVEHLAAEYMEVTSGAPAAAPVAAAPAPAPVAAPAPVMAAAIAPVVSRASVPLVPAAPRAAAQPVAPQAQQQHSPIAVVGMSGRFPMARDIAEYWSNLLAGRDCISEVPAWRWDWREIYGAPTDEGNKTDIKWGGFIDGVDEFDPLFFGISPREALYMDPMQRLLMQHTWHAIEDAGYSARAISGTRTGIFVGTSVSEYGMLMDRAGVPNDAFLPTGRSASLGANRMSYLLNLTGPSETVDTACSSSLVAIHRAVAAIESGDCDMALVGGANVLLAADGHVSFRKAGMLSPDGRSKTFAAGANGYARGEGAGMLFLKRLCDAERDGDNIYGLVRGTGENHGGRGSSLTAPNPKAQADLLKRVYTKAGIDPRSVGFIEAHGTGTPLGDPVEVNGMKIAFKDLYQASGDTTVRSAHCGIGSAKSNIGHLELAAGVAGAIKVLLQLKHQTLVKSLHSEEINPYIQLQGSPFYVVRETARWPAAVDASGHELPRRAGVSSFGFGGSNAHVVFEEYRAPVAAAASRADGQDRLIVLSAKTDARLRDAATQLLAAVANDDADLDRIAYTLQVGRESFDERLAFRAASLAEMREKLGQFLAGAENPDLHRAKVARDNALSMLDGDELSATVASWISKGQLNKLLALWVKGCDINWLDLYAGRAVLPQRVSLPGYPFAKERHWPQPAARVALTTAPAAAPVAASAPAARSVAYLQKTWNASAAAPGQGASAGQALILASDQTMALARLVAARVPGTIVNLSDAAGASAQLERVEAGSGCIDLTGCAAGAPDALASLPWLQLLAGQRTPMMLLGVTRGLEAFGNGAINLAGASRAGLFRMLQSEYAKLRSRHLDLDPAQQDDAAAAHIAAEWNSAGDDVEACYRNDQRYVPQLQEVSVSAQAAPLGFAAGDVLWITGGTRGIGLLCANHFVTRHGVRKLVLTGREALPPRAEWANAPAGSALSAKIAAVQALESQGVQVETLALALSDAATVQAQVRRIESSMGPIAGVLHCAGLNDFENPAFVRKGAAVFASVLEPKVAGLDALLSAVRHQPLKFFALFSSVAAAIPSLGAGQSDYVAANAYMDYVAMANAGTCPIVSIQWPSWKDTGMGEATTRSYRQTGLLSHTDAEGLQLLDSVLASKAGPVILPAIVDRAIWQPHNLMLRTLETPVTAKAAPAAAPVAAAAPVGDLAGVTLAWLAGMFAKELMVPADAIERDTPFPDYGVDSIMLSQILRRVDDALAAHGKTDAMDPSVFYEHPTLNAFAQHLMATWPAPLAGAIGAVAPTAAAAPAAAPVAAAPALAPASVVHATPAPVPAPAPAVVAPSAVRANDFAVVGLSCRFPGADDLDGFWRLLAEGRTAIGPVPAQRWGHATSYRAGLLSNVTDFDPGYFLLSDNDAKAMDPQALLLLEETLFTLHHAGYTARELKGSATGVYIGARSGHRPDAQALAEARNPIIAVGPNYLAANISQFFDLQGPSLVLDTACSSALVAMNMALQSLQTGEISAALVGGVSILQTEQGHQLFDQRKLLCTTEEFHVFDGRSNGVVLGEGVGMVMIKSLQQAIDDGDQIHAVIKGLAINNDGRTAGPATPNLMAQKAVMQQALRKAGMQPDDISYIHVNGSGSEVTDLLELKGMQAVYRAAGHTAPCELGSMEPNIGHPLCAKGIAGFIQLVLMLSHRQGVPFLSGQQAMAHYDIDSSPFHFGRELADWRAQAPVAALNCFADGGTNVHVILQGWNETVGREVRRAPIAHPQFKRRTIYGAPQVAAPALDDAWNHAGQPEGRLHLTIDHPVLRNHAAYGQQLLPGLAYIDILYQHFERMGMDLGELELRNLSIYNPLIVGADFGVLLDVKCVLNADGQHWQVQLEGREERAGQLSDVKRYAVAEMHRMPAAAYTDVVDLDQVRREARSTTDLKDLYAQCALQGLNHTGMIKAQGKVHENAAATHIEIAVGPEAFAGAKAYRFHPTLIDGSSVGAASLFASFFEGEDRLILPLFYGSFRASAPLQTACTTRISATSLRRKNDLIYMNMEFFNAAGAKVAELSNYACKLVREEGAINPDRKQAPKAKQAPAAAAAAPVAAHASVAVAQVAPAMQAADVDALAVRFLVELMASRVGTPADQIDVDLGYYELGLDSAKLLDLVGALEAKVGASLAPTLLFEYTTVAELASYLAEKYPAAWGQPVAAPAAPAAKPAPAVPAVHGADADAQAVRFLVELMASRVGTPADQIDVDLGYYELGLDSAKLLDLVGALEAKVGASLAPTLLFEYTTVAELASYLAEKYPSAWAQTAAAGAAAPAAQPAPVAPAFVPSGEALSMPSHSAAPAAVGEDIAIIGMSGRYPGADTLEQFWENLKAGTDSVTEIPVGRWERDRLAGVKSPSGKEMSRWGGFINEPERFDAQFFRISPFEAKLLDPQQRQFLEVCWEAIEDAGYTPKTLVEPRGRNQRRRVGVYAGVMHNDYALLTAEAVARGSAMPISLNYAQIANRVSYFCNFHGPSMAIDTVCSSSLIAVHMAMESLRSGECEVALAGGVNLSVHPSKYMTYGMMDMHASDGRCRTFGAGGDGYVSGEGVGTVVLKPLSAAVRDGDHIYAVVKGSTTNHVGTVSGLTVPSPVAQADMIEECLEKTGIHPRTISYVEAHGTGTSLGDPIEIQGLVRAFGHYTSDRQYCAIGSVKSNIGHAESAAGISGLAKVALQLRHKTLVPSLHSQELNPYLDFANSPFFVQHTHETWKQPSMLENGREVPVPRRAALSSFGASGSNAHLILEEYTGPQGAAAAPRTQSKPVVVPLSAKKAERLVAVAARLLEHVRAHGAELDLPNLAYTLQVGRESMEERVAFVVTSVDDLAAQLQAFVGGTVPALRATLRKGKQAAVNTVGDAQQLMGEWIASGRVGQLAQAWLEGAAIDWNEAHRLAFPNTPALRVSLPAYSFARDRHWVDVPAAPAPGAPVPPPPPSAMPVPAPVAKAPVQAVAAPVAAMPTAIAAAGSEVVYFAPRWKEMPLEAAGGAKRKTTVFVVGSAADAGMISQARVADEVVLLEAGGDIAAELENHTRQLLMYCKDSERIRRSEPELLMVVAPHRGSDYPYRSLMGALRTIAMELPFIKTRLVLDAALASGDAAMVQEHLRGELACAGTHTEVAYAQGQARKVLVQHVLEQSPVGGKAPLAGAIRQQGVYLITGGMGGLGMMFAEHIGRDTGARIVLTGRSHLSAKRKAALAALAAKGVDVDYIACDTGRMDDVQRLVDRVVAEYGALHGLIHSAGVVADNFIPRKTGEEVAAVFAAKVPSIINLDRATANLALDFFVSFSSSAAMGNAGQLDYATANAFLDTFSGERAAQVLRGERQGKSLSINWPLWKDGGMSVAPAYEKFMSDKYGVVPLQEEPGVRALASALASNEHQFGVFQGDQKRIAGLLTGAPARTEQRAAGGKRVDTDAAVLEAVAQALGMAPADIDPEVEFADYGMDSIGATKIASHLNDNLGIELSGAVFMELSSAAKLMEHLRDTVIEAAAEPQAAAAAPVAPTAMASVAPADTATAPIAMPTAPAAKPRAAIIGFDARLPGAQDADTFWNKVQRKEISIGAVAAKRWKERGVTVEGKKQGDYSSMQHAALLDDIDAFDAPFWGVDEDAARAMDPQERMLLKSIWHCVEHAGVSMKELTSGRVGLFLALDSTEYQELARSKSADPDAHAPMSVGMIANQISYLCNFTGPSEAIDNACASTYVALNRASQALANGECDTAIVGGAKVLLDPASFRGRAEGEILSSSGLMYPFDAQSDGYVRGEGVGCVLLKDVSRATQDGNTIHAVVAGVGVTHNGRGGLSPMAPSVDGQYRAIREAYRAAGVSPASVGYIEAHGTSNSFSDAAEMAAFKQFFKEEMDADSYRAHRVAVSTVKANIGHLEGASGVASLIKAICAIRDRKIAPTATWSKLHPSILLDKSPFWLPTEVTPWQAPAGQAGPLRMGLHSIGIGGVNAHVILEEHVAQEAPQAMAASTGGPQLVVFSARSKPALEAYCKAWQAHLASMPQEGEEGRRLLARLAASSQRAREPMPFRAAYLVSDLGALKAALALGVERIEREPLDSASAFAAAADASQGVRERIAPFAVEAGADLKPAALAWLAGRTLVWQASGNTRYVPIPQYPFQDRKVWFGEAADPFDSLFQQTFMGAQSGDLAVMADH